MFSNILKNIVLDPGRKCMAPSRHFDNFEPFSIIILCQRLIEIGRQLTKIVFRIRIAFRHQFDQDINITFEHHVSIKDSTNNVSYNWIPQNESLGFQTGSQKINIINVVLLRTRFKTVAFILRHSIVILIQHQFWLEENIEQQSISFRKQQYAFSWPLYWKLFGTVTEIEGKKQYPRHTENIFFDYSGLVTYFCKATQSEALTSSNSGRLNEIMLNQHIVF